MEYTVLRLHLLSQRNSMSHELVRTQVIALTEVFAQYACLNCQLLSDPEPVVPLVALPISQLREATVHHNQSSITQLHRTITATRRQSGPCSHRWHPTYPSLDGTGCTPDDSI